MRRIISLLVILLFIGCPSVDEELISSQDLQMSVLKSNYLHHLDEIFYPLGYAVPNGYEENFNEALVKNIQGTYKDKSGKESKISAKVSYKLLKSSGEIVTYDGNRFSFKENSTNEFQPFEVEVTLSMDGKRVSFNHSFNIAPAHIVLPLQPPSVKILRSEVEIPEAQWNSTLTPELWKDDILVVNGYKAGNFYYSFNNGDFQLYDQERAEDGSCQIKIPLPTGNSPSILFQTYVAPQDEDLDKLKRSSTTSCSLAVNTTNLMITGSTSSKSLMFWDYAELNEANTKTAEGETTYLQKQLKLILKDVVKCNPNLGDNYYDDSCSVVLTKEPEEKDSAVSLKITSDDSETSTVSVALGYHTDNGGILRKTSYYSKTQVNEVFDENSNEVNILKTIEKPLSILGIVHMKSAITSTTDYYSFFAFAGENQNTMISLDVTKTDNNTNGGLFTFRQLKGSGQSNGLKFNKSFDSPGYYFFLYTMGEEESDNVSAKFYEINKENGALGADKINLNNWSPNGYKGDESATVITAPSQMDLKSFAIGKLPSTITAATKVSNNANTNPETGYLGRQWADPSTIMAIYHLDVYEKISDEEANAKGAEIAAMLVDNGIIK